MFSFKLSPFRVNFACHRENVRLTQLDFPELNKYQITAAATFQTIGTTYLPSMDLCRPQSTLYNINFPNFRSQYQIEYKITKLCYFSFSLVLSLSIHFSWCQRIFFHVEIFMNIWCFADISLTFLIPQKKNKRWTQNFQTKSQGKFKVVFLVI